MNIINDAYAQTPQSGGGMSMLIMIGIFFVIMYFMIIRPQNKRAKEHNKLIDSLTNGTEVCYYVKVVYTTDAGTQSSANSATVCATPESWEPVAPSDLLFQNQLMDN